MGKARNTVTAGSSTTPAIPSKPRQPPPVVWPLVRVADGRLADDPADVEAQTSLPLADEGLEFADGDLGGVAVADGDGAAVSVDGPVDGPVGGGGDGVAAGG